MRLPEATIKEAIIHPEKLVRQEALLYFTDCYSRDPEVMPLAIKAIETYGRSQAFLHVHGVRGEFARKFRVSLAHQLAEALLQLSDCPDLVEDSGHLYGADLTDAQKKDLIAFLKTL